MAEVGMGLLVDVRPGAGAAVRRAAADVVAEVAAAPRAMPFAPERVRCVASLGSALLAHPDARDNPAVAALGFALRPAAIAQQQRSWRQGEAQSVVRVNAGLVFHVPPANVETLFAFTWAQSLLMGNANIVRIPSAGGLMTGLILAEIAAALGDHAHLQRGAAFVSYPRDQQTTALFAGAADLRLLWGSDETIAQLRALPLAAGAREVCFGTRYSLAVLSAAHVRGLDDPGLTRLAEDFANDLASFDQRACASPHRLIWVGDRAGAAIAAERFFARLEAVLRARSVPVDPGRSLTKITAMYRAALGEDRWIHRSWGPYLDVMQAESLQGGQRIAPGGGLLLQAQVETLAEVAACILPCDQTLSHAGFARPDLTRLVEQLCGRGVDRMVPVGQALQLATVWDGVDLTQAMSRAVSVSA